MRVKTHAIRGKNKEELIFELEENLNELETLKVKFINNRNFCIFEAF